jgi:large subunit ribosomal protein L32e
MAESKPKNKEAKKPTEKKAEAKKPAAEKKVVKTEAKKPAHKDEAEKKPVHKEEAKKPAAHKGEAEKKETKEEHKAATKESEPKAAAKPKAKAKVPEAKKKEEKPKKEIKITKIQFKAEIKPSEGKYKPTFRRQEGLRYKRLKEVWRRPTGIDSKKLEKQRGKGYLPSIGYKKPKAESGKQSGFDAVRVFTADELKKINPKTQAAVIAAPVGRRKRNIIIEEANKLKITILNPRRGEI